MEYVERKRPLSAAEIMQRQRDMVQEQRKASEQERATLYGDVPDARQDTEVDAPVSRFRPTYRALTPQEKAVLDQIKEMAVELENLYGLTDQSPRYKALAITALEESVMWAIKALTDQK